jgi:hypothetical protein
MDVAVTDRRGQHARLEESAGAVERHDHAAGKGCGAAGLVVDDVAVAVGDDLIARLADRADGELVRHRAARNVERGLVT